MDIMVPANNPSYENTQQMWIAYKKEASPALREELILTYAPLVKKVVGRMGLQPGGAIEWEDLLNYGIIGLIDAVERFEPDRGVAFQTFATLRIRGSVLDALRQFDPLGRLARRRVRAAKEAIQRLTNQLGRAPEDEEVAEAIGLTIEQYQQVLQDASFMVLSLERPMGSGADGNSFSLTDLLEDPEAETALEQVEESELRERLASAIASLSRREQILLSLYYYEELTMREVAKVMDISQTRVCQLHARAILNLKAIMAPPPPPKADEVQPTAQPPEEEPPAQPSSPAEQTDGNADRKVVPLDKRRARHRSQRKWAELFGKESSRL